MAMSATWRTASAHGVLVLGGLVDGEDVRILGEQRQAGAIGQLVALLELLQGVDVGRGQGVVDQHLATSVSSKVSICKNTSTLPREIFPWT